MKNLLILFLLGTISLPAFSQIDSTTVITQDTLSWKTVKIITRTDSTKVRIPCDFITFGASRIELQIGTMHHEFDIHETEGTWPNLMMNGAITYFLTEARDRYVILSRSDAGVRITVDFTVAGGLRQLYSIESITLQPN